MRCKSREWQIMRNEQVDEEDDVDMTIPLLQELEIDFRQIVRTVVWMILYPWTSLCKNNLSGNMPFSEASHEFWGPFLVVLMYGLVLLWGQFKVFSKSILLNALLWHK